MRVLTRRPFRTRKYPERSTSKGRCSGTRCVSIFWKSSTIPVSIVGDDVPLEIDHVVPRKPRSGLPGTDRVNNLVLACTACNSKKGNMPIEEFLGNRPEVLARIRRQMKAPLQDAAAMNATRYEIGRVLRGMGVPVSFWTGGRTRFNRTSQGLSKQHWIDAACVGERGGRVVLPRGITPLQVEAKGRGKRQVVRTDKYGFPVGKAGRIKRVHGYQTGDVVLLRQPQGNTPVSIMDGCQVYEPPACLTSRQQPDLR